VKDCPKGLQVPSFRNKRTRHKLKATRRVLQSSPSLHPSAVAVSLPSPLQSPRTCMFRATGLSYPPPIPLRLLHSFSPAADLSISSHSLSLIILLLLLLLLLLLPLSSLLGFHLRRILHLTLSPSRSVGLLRAPGPAFLSPGNCSNFDPRDIARPVGMWTLRTCAPVFLIQEHIQTLLNTV